MNFKYVCKECGRITTKPKVTAFLREYYELCAKYGLWWTPSGHSGMHIERCEQEDVKMIDNCVERVDLRDPE